MQNLGLRAVRPLANATLQRIERGIRKFVLDAKEPFCVTYGQHDGHNRSGLKPLHTITASPKDQNAIIMPTLIQTGYGERRGQKPRAPGLHKPLGTLVAGGGKHALVAAFLAQHNTGVVGRSAIQPVSTLTTSGSHQQVVAAHLMNMHGAARSARDLSEPHSTICAGGQHSALVATFLQKYYGHGCGQKADSPLHTLSTRDTFGLVTVEIDGTTYAITDIGIRMLTPREQFRAQGFPENYIITHGADGRVLTSTEQIRMCGNSVCPPLAEALVRANLPATLQKELVA